MLSITDFWKLFSNVPPFMNTVITNDITSDSYENDVSLLWKDTVQV